MPKFDVTLVKTKMKRIRASNLEAAQKRAEKMETQKIYTDGWDGVKPLESGWSIDSIKELPKE